MVVLLIGINVWIVVKPTLNVNKLFSGKLQNMCFPMSKAQNTQQPNTPNRNEWKSAHCNS